MRSHFADFFSHAMGQEGPTPYDYQRRLAGDPEVPGAILDGPRSLAINVPTGAGKTAAAVLAWLWNRCGHPEAEHRKRWPRRLVYCLPMRVLVEQTRDNVNKWVDRLSEADMLCELPVRASRSETPNCFTLMGGDLDEEWQSHPEKPAILIGTQDMLLSRALNRGYAMSRYRWPIHFALLNNDCLWVCDEVQLMGPGLATALQLEAFREQAIDGKPYFGAERPCFGWYMSATTSRKLLASREWRKQGGDRRPDDFEFGLSVGELGATTGHLAECRLATKTLETQPNWNCEDAQIVQRILTKHVEMVRSLTAAVPTVPRRTLVICNTVDRAVKLFEALRSASPTDEQTELILLHSRFRRPDRKAQMKRLEAIGPRSGQIVVATQVIEAGVDLSSGMLWTEVAPLASIVQRLGRLNRSGEFGHEGQTPYGWMPFAIVVGIKLPDPPSKDTEKTRKKWEEDKTAAYLPYDRTISEAAWDALLPIAAIQSLTPAVDLRSPHIERDLQPPPYSLQRHELLDFFDTDSNLSLGYTDVSPFIRGTDPDTDVYVLWRTWEADVPPFGWDISDDELCHVPIWMVKGREGLATWRRGFVWQGKDDGWQPVDWDSLFPGATLLLPTSAGGYHDGSDGELARGWTGIDKDGDVRSLHEPRSRPSDEDLLSHLDKGWQSIPDHTQDVDAELSLIMRELGISDDTELGAALHEGVTWHDLGKTLLHWQAATRLIAAKADLEWPRDRSPVAKFSFSNSPLLVGKTGAALASQIWEIKRAFRPKLRHEVASALALRQKHRRRNPEGTIPDLLAEYLVAAHHGYVRKVLRDDLPKQPLRRPRDVNKVRGIREGVSLPELHILGETLGPEEGISIECRQMGRCKDGAESWTKGVLRLLEHYGPFRLAWYETLARIADWRASANPKTRVVDAKPKVTGGGTISVNPEEKGI